MKIKKLRFESPKELLLTLKMFVILSFGFQSANTNISQLYVSPKANYSLNGQATTSTSTVGGRMQ